MTAIPPATPATAPARPRLLRRLILSLLLLALALTVDRQAGALLRSLLLYEHWGGELREALSTAKFLASGLGTLLVVVIIATLDRQRRRALVLLAAVLLAASCAGLLKVVSGRERPYHLAERGGQERLAFFGPERGLHEAPYQSFPSGHVTTAWASATCLACFYPPARVVVYGVATVTGLNRVLKRQHHLSDVVAGAGLGHLMALLVLRWRRRRHDPGDAPG